MELNFKTLQDDHKGTWPNAWTFLIRQSALVGGFHSREGDKVSKASNSELKRWIQNGALQINCERVNWDELIDFPIFSVVLFPKNDKQRTTLL